MAISLARLGAAEQANTLAAETMASARNRLGQDHPFTRLLTQALAPALPADT